MQVRHVAFLCNGLGEGRNGVGDYCRRLAHTLAAMHVRCDIMALGDPDCSDLVEAEIKPADELPAIRTARIPESFSTSQRSAIAAAILQRWQPEWVSLQFVCYGFHRKGIVYRELYWLPPLLRGFRLSVMLHELWIGIPPGTGLWRRVVGAAQRVTILRLLRHLHPTTIATSNPYYRDVLAKHGVAASLLPLVGNIPITAESAEAWLDEAVRAAGGPNLTDGRRCYLLLGMFGGIAGNWQATALLGRLDDWAQRNRRRVVIISAGEAGPFAPLLFKEWKGRYPEIDFVIIGPRPAREVSQFFNSVDAGLSSYASFVLGRSGSAAAMLEHGLHVIVSWGYGAADPPPVDPIFASMIWKDDAWLDARLAQPSEKRPRPDWAAIMARRFLDQLEGAEIRPEERERQTNQPLESERP